MFLLRDDLADSNVREGSRNLLILSPPFTLPSFTHSPPHLEESPTSVSK